MVKYSKARKTKDGGEDAGLVDISVPHFRYPRRSVNTRIFG